jgi:hypothetical protein
MVGIKTPLYAGLGFEPRYGLPEIGYVLIF